MVRRINIAEVSDWVKECKRAQTSIHRTAAQKVGNDVTKTVNEGGLLPIKSGNLRSSFKSSTSAMVTMDSTPEEYSSEDWQLAILGAEMGKPLYMGFRAAYAARQNYGFTGSDSLGRNYNQSGKFFLEATEARWQNFVREAETEHAID